MQISPIGTIYTPFKEIGNMPIQPSGARGVSGQIVLRPELVNGLADLDGFSHIIVLFLLHRVVTINLTVTPFLDPEPHGVFATRAPTRPNPIGFSILELKKITGNILQVENIDILDSTPLLDIKPYVPEFDQPEGPVQIGWLQNSKNSSQSTRSDQRFG
ncbi:MAG TPA: tRNA (N6-threonylcarbamoyladenosine(37)-N6)-methyltransferase TrmO [Geopsychrobacteraceae bacterium]|nr:tRNA (N6-threonylcarbamoyladenosine(37)-N6)-methyltransferase TrmO [Geopsychrobacteraceae bacterium]